MDHERSGGAEEEWSWTDTDEEDIVMDSSIPDPSETVSTRIGLPVKSRSVSLEDDGNGSQHQSSGEMPGPSQASQSPMRRFAPSSLQAKVQDMVAQGVCTPQAGDLFLKIEAESSGQDDSPRAQKKKLQATEAKLQHAEEAQLRLQAEVMRLSLQPRNDGDSGAGVTAFDVARAQREAEKVLILQRKVAESEENERQQSVVNSKMEELLRLQEDALHDREENVAKLEKELANAKGALTNATAQLEESEKKQQEAETVASASSKRADELEEALVERDEKLRSNDKESLSIYEARLEEKEAQLAQAEARLAAQGGDQIGPLKKVIEDARREVEERESRVQALSSELFQVKLGKDQEQMKAESLQTATRDLRAESEQVQLALSIVEPKVHVLQAMLADIQGNVSRRDSNFQSQKDRLGRSALDHEARGRFFHGQVEELKKALFQRDQKIQTLQEELDKARGEGHERDGIEELMLQAKEVAQRLQEDNARKEMRIQTLQDSLDQMTYAMDRTQGQLGERETRLHLLQSAFDQSQPAMAIARKAVEERDMKLDAFQVLLRLGEGQVQENLKALDDAYASIREKEEALKNQLALIHDQAERLRHMEQMLETKTRENAAWEGRMSFLEQSLQQLQAKAGEYKRMLEQIEKREFTAGSGYDDVVVTPATELPSTKEEEKEVLPEDHVVVGNVPLSAVRSMGFGEFSNVSGRAVLTLPRMAHAPLENAGEHQGAVAVIERGECSFLEKAVRAQEAGAVGVVFVNSDDQLYQPVSLPGAQNEGLCSLPVMCVRRSDGPKLLPGSEVSLRFGTAPPEPTPGSAAPLAAHSPPPMGREGAISPSEIGAPHTSTLASQPPRGVYFSDRPPSHPPAGAALHDSSAGGRPSVGVSGHPPTIQSSPAAHANSVPWAPALQPRGLPGLPGALPATGPLGAQNAKRVVSAGGELVEQRRGRLTGSLMRQELFFRVVPPGLLQWRGRSARIAAVFDGAGQAVNEALLDPSEALRSFRIRVTQGEGAAQPQQQQQQRGGSPPGGEAGTWEVELMASSPDEKNLWLEGAAQFTRSEEEARVGGGTMWHSYNGQLMNGLPHGRGIAMWGNGDQYMGEWEGGLLSGSGIFEWGNGDVYTGQWREGMRHGPGILAAGDGTMYQGEWASHRQHGRGVEASKDGDKYSGSWVGGAKNGLGIWSYADGNRRAVDCRGGAEVWSGSYPQPDEVTQKRLLVSLDNARASAQAAAQAAAYAQAVCQQLEQRLVNTAKAAALPLQLAGPGGPVGGSPGQPGGRAGHVDAASTWAAQRAQQQAVAASLPVMAASAAGERAAQRLASGGAALGGRLVDATTQDGAATRMQPPPPAAADIVMASLAGGDHGEGLRTSVTPVAAHSQAAADAMGAAAGGAVAGGPMMAAYASGRSPAAGGQGMGMGGGAGAGVQGGGALSMAASFATTRSPGLTASPPQMQPPPQMLQPGP